MDACEVVTYICAAVFVKTCACAVQHGTMAVLATPQVFSFCFFLFLFFCFLFVIFLFSFFIFHFDFSTPSGDTSGVFAGRCAVSST